MHKKSFRLFLVMIVLVPAMAVSWLAVGGALAGGVEIDCRHPRIWERASINAVILPYTYIGNHEDTLSETAKELTHLLQMYVLFSILKFDRVGMTGLSSRGMSVEVIQQECNAESVMAKLLGRQEGAENHVRRGKAVVFLWGYLYEEGQEVYVQSYIRFLRRDVDERVDLPFNAAGTGQVLKAGLQNQSIAFAPRRLTAPEIRDISKAFRENARLYTRPDPASRSWMLRPMAPLQFRIEDARDGWMYLRGYEGGENGWVPVRASIDALPIDRKLPELIFVEAASGYLRYQLHRKGVDRCPKPERLVRWTRNNLHRYESAIPSGHGPEALATARVLTANLELQSTHPAEMLPAARIAEVHYNAATNIVPYSADIRNLAAITGIYIGAATGWSERKPADYAQALIGSLALDPGNLDILSNLENLLTSIRRLPENVRHMSAADLDGKLAAVRRVQASLRSGQ